MDRSGVSFGAYLFDGVDDFFDVQLPAVMAALLEVMDGRVDYIVNHAKYFEGSFLAKEGLIAQNRFTAMCGVFGL